MSVKLLLAIYSSGSPGFVVDACWRVESLILYACAPRRMKSP